MRAARFAERVEEYVATASTSVPPAVASEAIVPASAMHAQASGCRSRAGDVTREPEREVWVDRGLVG